MSTSKHNEEEMEEVEEEEIDEEDTRPIYKFAILGGESVHGDKVLEECEKRRSDCIIEAWSVLKDESRFHDKYMLKVLANKARAIFFVFSLVNASTIQNVITWYEECNKTNTHYFPIIVGTNLEAFNGKLDDTQRNQIVDTVKQLAQKMNAAVVFVPSTDASITADLAVQLNQGNLTVASNPQVIDYENVLKRSDDVHSFHNQ